ncbi:MAG TPA: site-specific integrase, partial [Burkholderiaceae bacterium]|nr:site-specific integrase [Burkholderiaceae bacterium]
MASFKKCPVGWRVEVYVKGTRKSATFETKREAQLWAAKTDAELRAHDSGRSGEIKTTHDAFDRYAKEIAPTHKGEHWEVLRLKKFEREFPKVILSKLSATHVQEWRDMRLASVAPGTVLREMKLLNSVFEQCRREWLWL